MQITGFTTGVVKESTGRRRTPVAGGAGAGTAAAGIPKGAITSSAIDSNGRRVLLGSSSGLTELYAVSRRRSQAGDARKLVKTFQALDGEAPSPGLVSAVAFSVDDKKVAAFTNGDRALRIWDAGTGRLQALFQNVSHPVNRVSFSKSIEYVLVSGDTKVSVFRLEDDSEIQRDRSASAAAFSADGDQLIVCDSVGIEIVNLRDGDVVVKQPVAARMSSLVCTQGGVVLIRAVDRGLVELRIPERSGSISEN